MTSAAVQKYRDLPLCIELEERAAVAWSYWLDCSPHERTEDDGMIVAHYARLANTKLAQQAHALREAERFLAYFAGETGNTFVGSGTPKTCLELIRNAIKD